MIGYIDQNILPKWTLPLAALFFPKSTGEDDGKFDLKTWQDGLEKEKTPERKKIVESAKSLLNSKNFCGPEVDGGNLACAQVVTTALLKAGYLDTASVSVPDTVNTLKKKGWTLHEGLSRPGDVVVWNRTRKETQDGHVELGHPHIGIVVDADVAMSNSSKEKTPRLHKMGLNAQDDGYWYKRGIAYYLSPPIAENLNQNVA